MITETTFARLDVIIAKMDARKKEQHVSRTEAAHHAIATRVRMGNTIRMLKQLQARQNARK